MTSTTETTLSFDELGLSESVLDAVTDLGYTEPSPVQAQAIPYVIEGRDVLAAAQTGTGKTAAFLLPTMSKLGRTPRRHGPSMLVVTPTRELAQQIEKVCTTIELHTHHHSVTVVGGVSYGPQKAGLSKGCDILVATPGRLVDLIDQGVAHLSEVRVLVLDEADRMLDMGFLPAVRKIVAQTPATRQTLLFSATLDESAVGSILDLVHEPALVEIAHKGTVAETIDQFVLPVSVEAKNVMLGEILKSEGPQHVIVFTRTKHRADSCCRRLRRAGISCAPIHGDRSQKQRERALASFRSGSTDVLVATDVLARGIDISDVRYVINFDVPADPEDYIHRIGRTGRAGETGWALTFVTTTDIDDLYACEQLIGLIIPTFEPKQPLDTGTEPPQIDESRTLESIKHARKSHSRSKHGRGQNSQRKTAQRSGQRQGGQGYSQDCTEHHDTQARGRSEHSARKQQSEHPAGGAGQRTRSNSRTSTRKSGRGAAQGAAIVSQTPSAPSKPSNNHRRRPGDKRGRAQGTY